MSLLCGVEPIKPLPGIILTKSIFCQIFPWILTIEPCIGDENNVPPQEYTE